MRAKHKDILQATVEADDGRRDIWLTWYTWTTGRGRRRARLGQERAIEWRADREFPGWKRISYNVIRSTPL